MSNISTLRKKRGVVRASITRLTNRLRDLERDADRPATLDLARGMACKIDALDSDFRAHHHALIDLIDDEDTLQREQTTLDDHDDFVAELAAPMEQLVNLARRVCPPLGSAARRPRGFGRLHGLGRTPLATGCMATHLVGVAGMDPQPSAAGRMSARWFG